MAVAKADALASFRREVSEKACLSQGQPTGPSVAHTGTCDVSVPQRGRNGMVAPGERPLLYDNCWASLCHADYEGLASNGMEQVIRGAVVHACYTGSPTAAGASLRLEEITGRETFVHPAPFRG